jgi:hypothetical protein
MQGQPMRVEHVFINVGTCAQPSDTLPDGTYSVLNSQLQVGVDPQGEVVATFVHRVGSTVIGAH